MPPMTAIRPPCASAPEFLKIIKERGKTQLFASSPFTFAESVRRAGGEGDRDAHCRQDLEVVGGYPLAGGDRRPGVALFLPAGASARRNRLCSQDRLLELF